MSPFIMDWLNLLVRWAHLIAGIGWIGTSFYFIALDYSLKKREKMRDGVMGTAWEVHGGGFYNVEKFSVAPAELPDDLIWYKWEAYLTWVTGIILMVVQFYMNAGTWMIDAKVMELTSSEAIGTSIVSLALGWFIYDGLCRSRLGKNTPLLMALVFMLILGAAYFYTHVFSARAALIHVGAFIGTLMAFNVFRIIIPNQKKITAALMAGEKPDGRYGIMGKQRSVHNTYLTLPVLVMMVAGHYPFIADHSHAWLLVGLVIIGGACLRHALIRHEVGDPLKGYAWTLPIVFAALVTAMIMTKPQAEQKNHVKLASDVEVLTIVGKHCISCHALEPVHEAFDVAPKSVIFETKADVRRYKDLIIQFTVESDLMPIGNETAMTQSERKLLGDWLKAQEE